MAGMTQAAVLRQKIEALQVARGRVRQSVAELKRKLINLSASQAPKKVVVKAELATNKARVMERIMERRFQLERQQGPGSPKWRPLNPRYLAWKIRMGYKRKILQRTGLMRELAISGVAGTFKHDRRPNWAGEVFGPEYAEHAHAQRPYHKNPSAAEMKVALDVFKKKLKEELKKYLEGKGGYG